MRREVVPAVGCTEPAAVALCVARACEKWRAKMGAETTAAPVAPGITPDKIAVRLSPNVLKNAMGVGIPGTGMTGLPIAIALGAVAGRSEYGLEVFRDANPAAVAKAQQMISEGRIEISVKEGLKVKLYIEVEVWGAERDAHAVIMIEHARFVEDGEIAALNTCNPEACAGDVSLDLHTVWQMATEAPLSEIDFILEAARLNKAVAEHSLQNEYGHCVGRVMARPEVAKLVGDGVLRELMVMTCAACDARMAGAMNPVMSNSGSGNQGITATLPVVAYAEQMGATQEQLTRALTLSHLTAIYIKQSLGRLSALCGCVVAATGSSCGITLLMGGGYNAVSLAVKYMVANITGMICDGAKPSCSLKLTTGISTALLSAVMAMEHHRVDSAEGIVSDDADQTIRNMTIIGREGMCQTDELILKIMTDFRE